MLVKQREAAFTLIELLIVVAIIAALAGLLLPVLSNAREKARQSACLSNMKQIGDALDIYVSDNDETYPGASMSVKTASNSGNDTRIPFEMQLMPYAKSDQIWTCPSDSAHRDAPISSTSPYGWWDKSYMSKLIPRSYGYIANINTVEASGQPDPNTGMSTYSRLGDGRGCVLSKIEEPSEIVVFAEIYATARGAKGACFVGTDNGSTLTGCNTWKLPGRAAGSDLKTNGCSSDASGVPATGHFNGGDYIFADGHVKWMTWSIARHDDFYYFKRHKSGVEFTP
jgi:prepilin-type N-terminal cleavage/methylation domain-containing protein